MNNMFDNLREKLNSTVLKEVDFSEKSKEQVRKAIKKSRVQNKKRIHSKMNYVFSLTATLLVVLGLGFFAVKQIGYFNENQLAESLEDSQEIKTGEAFEETQNLYIPPEKEEYYEDMTKEEIVMKMLNTPLYFETAMGKFEVRNVYDDDTGSHNTVEYIISAGKEIGGRVTFINQSLEGTTVQEMMTVFNQDKEWHIDVLRNSYYERDFQLEEFEPVTMEEVFSIAEFQITDHILTLYESKTPPASIAGVALYPYHSVVFFLDQLELWEIEKQNEELLGHNTIVIYGQVPDKVALMDKAETFRYWIDKDTGIIVKYEQYDANGNLTGFLHPEELKINAPVNLNEFRPNLEGLEQMFIPASDTNVKDNAIEYIAHADYYEEFVEEVLNLLKRDMDFLYVFSGEDFSLFSASYERYQDFNHAYLTYSYKKDPNEDGSGTRLLYVREYHKDSYVRSWGEFATNKGDEIGSFTINGIQWQIYEVDIPGSVHLVGTMGDYMYEIVTQEIAASEMEVILESFKPSE